MSEYGWLDECFMARPGTEKDFKPEWQAHRYMLRGKMYAMTGIHDPTGRPMATMKLEPAYSELLRGQYADIIPGYYMNKQHWSTVFLDGQVPGAQVCEMVAAAHKALLATLSKKAQREIMEGPNGG